TPARATRPRTSRLVLALLGERSNAIRSGTGVSNGAKAAVGTARTSTHPKLPGPSQPSGTMTARTSHGSRAAANRAVHEPFPASTAVPGPAMRTRPARWRPGPLRPSLPPRRPMPTIPTKTDSTVATVRAAAVAPNVSTERTAVIRVEGCTADGDPRPESFQPPSHLENDTVGASNGRVAPGAGMPVKRIERAAIRTIAPASTAPQIPGAAQTRLAPRARAWSSSNRPRTRLDNSVPISRSRTEPLAW